jgi:hypothetical protein
MNLPTHDKKLTNWIAIMFSQPLYQPDQEKYREIMTNYRNAAKLNLRLLMGT